LADDDLLYTAYGDGAGFSNSDTRYSLGFATVAGDPPTHTGQDFRSDADTPVGEGPNGIKASGLLMVDGVLYMFVRNYIVDRSFSNSRLAWSLDHGRTWVWANWYFADTFGCPEFVQFGNNYAGARDMYVYIASQANDSAYSWSPDIVLARVPQDRMADRSAYEFFAGKDSQAQPLWSSDINQRRPVFTDPNGTQRISMTYNAALRRYFLTSSHQDGSGNVHTPALGVFDAPEPWGPWTTVYYNDTWSEVPTYHHKFPTKWMSDDGRTMWLVFSGSGSATSGCYNCFVVRKATLTLNTDPPVTLTSSDPSPSPSSTPTSRTHVRDMTFEQGSLTGPDGADSLKGTVRGDLWFGDEFGPFLLHTDATGRVLEAPIPLPGVQSPDNPTLGSNTPNLPRSRGFEGMAISQNRKTLYPMLEGALTTDPDQRRRLIYEFDLTREQYTGITYQYHMEAADNSIGDFTALDQYRFVVIERDGAQGAAAQLKRIYQVDLRQVDAQGF